MFGGVRFGGTVSADEAFALGFDHVALAIGAGRPTVLDLPNGLARGVRTASDFLMALQLTGAAKTDSIANMQLRLPVVVIGGGLTAIDTATESLAYYPLQVEKFLLRYELLARRHGEAAARIAWTDEERVVADEFLAHARALRAEAGALPRKGASRGSRAAASVGRRHHRLPQAPDRQPFATPLNHEEVAKALEEGVRFAEGLTPLAIETDDTGCARSLRVSVAAPRRGRQVGRGAPGGAAGKTILIAAGTQPNTVLAREDAATFKLDGRYFQACDETGAPVTPGEGDFKPAAVRVLLSMRRDGNSGARADGRFMSYFGDVHPSYFGNVVKAIGSAKQGYPVVSRVLEKVAPASTLSDAEFLGRLNDELRATVHEVVRLTPMIVEVVVRAPLAARRFRPGQFYRLQNFETLAPAGEGTRLAMEGIALTGAWVDRERGLISTIVLEMGGSSDLCLELKRGEPVILMGPTGTPTEIPTGETVVLAGGGLGNAVLFSIGQAMRRAGNRVLYFAAYKHMADRYKLAEIEAASGRGRMVLRRGAGIHARPSAVTAVVRRQHRAGYARLRERARWESSRSRSGTPTASSRSAPTA